MSVQYIEALSQSLKRKLIPYMVIKLHHVLLKHREGEIKEMSAAVRIS